MAINVDLSKPLTDEEIADLESRLPLSQVEHYKALAAGAEFEGGETKTEVQPPTGKGKVPPPPPPKDEK